MPARAWIRRLFAGRPTSTIRKPIRRPLGVEAFEDRVLPAGGLRAAIDPALVRLNPGTPGEIRLAGDTVADTQALAAFFGAANGQAGTQSAAATLTVGGESVHAAFTFTEFAGGNSGVAALAGDASVTLGSPVGVRLSGGDGAFVLTPTGAAGTLTAEDFTDGAGVDVVGLRGLALDAATTDGLTFRLNTTGGAVSKTVTGPGRSFAVSFPDGTAVGQVAGAADFKVSGPNGTVARVGGRLTATRSGTGLAVAGDQVSFDLYSGSTRAVTLGSSKAAFTLGPGGFALGGPFTVTSFALLPSGLPVTADAGNYPAAGGGFTANLGVVNLANVAPTLDALSFGTGGLEATVGIRADAASIGFKKLGGGSSNGLMSAGAKGLHGSFSLAGPVDPSTGLVSGLGATGGFTIAADSFELTVPKVLVASARNIAIGYDPRATGDQQLLAADDLSVEVPALKLKGEFHSSDTLPGLVVRTDGFAFGSGRVTYTGTVTLGPSLHVTGPFVELGDFTFSTHTGVQVGTFAVGAAGLDIGPSKKFNLTGEDVKAELGFDAAGGVDRFTFTAGSVDLTVGGIVELKGEDIYFSPTATGTDPVLKLSSATAAAHIPNVALEFSGTGTNISVLADGTFTGPDHLRIEAQLGSSDEAAAEGLGWPAIIPLRQLQVSLDWAHFREDPDKFLIHVTAAVAGRFGPLTLSGGVDDLVIDPQRLIHGEFPVVGIAGFSAGVEGDFFGGSVKGELLAGIVKLDAEGNVLPEDDPDFAQTVFYGGIDGGFNFLSVGGLEIKVAFSERGLLGAYFSAGVPVVLDPVSGATLTNFRGGVTFNAVPWETPTDPGELATPAFKPVLSLTADEWQEQVKEQVINQVQGGSRIFTVEEDVAEIVNHLPHGTAAAGLTPEEDDPLAKLFEKFDDKGYAVADAEHPGEVTEIVGGSQWLVTYKGAAYVLEYSADRQTIDVTRAQFAAAFADLEDALAAGTISSDLVAAFADNNIEVHPNAVVSVVQTEHGEPVKWKVVEDADSDGKPEATYFVTKRGGTAAVTGGVEGFGAMESAVRIEGGATLTSIYTGGLIRADVDLVIEPGTGKFLVVGKAITPEFSFAVRMFADLSSVDDEHPTEPLKFLFLADIPDPDSLNPIDEISPEKVRIKGVMTFEFLDADGNLVNPVYTTPAAFRFQVLGRTEVTYLDVTKIIIGGEGGPTGGYARLALTVESGTDADTLTLDASGSLSIESFISADDLVSCAGKIVFRKPHDGALEVTGALELNFDAVQSLPVLKQIGVDAADVDMLLAFNSTGEEKTLTLKLPGREEETLVLAPTTLELDGTGTLHIAPQVAGFGAYLTLDGAFSMRLSRDVAVPAGGSPDPTVRGDGGWDIDLFLDSRVAVGLTIDHKDLTLLRFDGLGVIAVRDVGAVDPVTHQVLAPAFAARVDLAIQAGIPHVLAVTGTTQLLVNTTGTPFVYVVPDRLAEKVRAIEAEREGVAPSEAHVPALRQVNGRWVVDVPDHPDALRNDPLGPIGAGPYLDLQIGDVDEPVESTTDTDGDGLVNASVTILDAYKVTGAFRVTVSGDGFVLAADGMTRFAVPGVGDLLKAESFGLLRIGPNGLVGALEIDGSAGLNIPGVGMVLDAGISTFIGINTTSNPFTVTQIPADYDQTVGPKSARLMVKGHLKAGGLDIHGLFSVEVGARAVKMMIDAGINVFDLANVSVKGTAAIYYGTNPGLVLDTQLRSGVSFGASGFFDVGADLSLHIDSRAGSRRFEIGLDNAHVQLLKVLEVSGSGKIIATDDYFRIEGSFHGSLLSIVTVDASGFLDSDGNFELSLAGNFQIGDDDWGVQAGGHLHILRDMTRTPKVPLAFDADLRAGVRAAGLTLLGAGVKVEYASPPAGDGKIKGEVDIDVLFVHIPITFTLGYIRLDVPPDPHLAGVTVTPTGSVLSLNVGSRAAQRGLSQAEKDEQYTITSVGPGTHHGEKVRVQAFGATEFFDDIDSISGDFGDGNDQVILGDSLGSFRPMTVNIIGGDGADLLINQSHARATLSGGAGADFLLSKGTADVLDGGEDNDELTGGAGATLLGGGGDDTLVWHTDLGRPAMIDGGAGTDRLLVYGTDAPETFALDGSAAGLSVVVGGPNPATLTAAGIEAVKLTGATGKDSLAVSVAGLTAAGVTAVDADLSRKPGKQPGTIDGPIVLLDDGAVDAVTITGTAAADAFTVTPVTDATEQTADVKVTVGGLTVTLHAPGGATDGLTLQGGRGNDTFTVSAAGGVSAAGAANRVRLSLQGGEGDDSATVPVGRFDFDGGPGTNALTFVGEAGTNPNITVTNTRVTAGAAAGTFTNVGVLSLDATAVTPPDPYTVAPDITVQSTIAGPTSVTAAGGRVTVAGSNGPLDVSFSGAGTATVNATGGPLGVHLAGGTGTVNIHNVAAPVNVTIAASQSGDQAAVTIAAVSANAPVTVTADALQDGTVSVGTGLLSRVAAPVTMTNIRAVVYDNSRDGAAGSYTISDSGITFGGVTYSSFGARRIELRTGLGDAAVTSTLGRATQTVSAGPGTNRIDATLTGSPTDLHPYDEGNLSFHGVLAAGGFQQVNFANPDNPTATAWGLTDGSLSGAGVPLLYAPRSPLNVALGAGDDTVVVSSIAAASPTTVDLGGGTNTAVVGDGDLGRLASPLSLTAAGAGNALVVNDTASPADPFGRTRPLALTPNSIASAGQPVAYTQDRFATLAVNLGAANDAVTARDLPAHTTVDGGAGDDHVTASGSLNDLAVNGGSGADTLTLTAGTGGVTFAGGDGPNTDTLDTLEADRSDAATGLDGSLATANGRPVLTLAGLPAVSMPTSPAEMLTIKLGAGNDTFAVDSAGYNPRAVSLLGGKGDDAVTFRSVGGDAFQVYGDTPQSVAGDTGQNTVTVVVPANPADRSFNAVVPHVQRLVVDHTAGVAAAAWTVQGTQVWANGSRLIDAEGAGRIDLFGGSSAGDTLTVTGSTTSRPLTVTLDGNTADVYEGLNVLTQSTPPVVYQSTPQSVDGLSQPTNVAATADGRLVFTISAPVGALQPGTNTVSVFRTDGAGGPLTYVGKVPVPAAAIDVTGVAVRPDGRWLFVSADEYEYYRVYDFDPPTANRVTSGVVYVYEVDPVSAALTFRQRIIPDAVPAFIPPNGGGFPNTTRPINSLAISPDGKTLVVEKVIGDLSQPSQELLRTYRIDTLAPGGQLGDPVAAVALPPALSSYPIAGWSGLWFSPDSQYAFTANNGSGILMLQRAADLSYRLYRSIPAAAGLQLGRYSQVQPTPDGKYLFAVVAASQVPEAPGHLDVFKIDETAAGEQIRNWGTLPNVSSFAYSPATQTLVAIDSQPYGNFRYVHQAVYHFDPVTGTFGSPTPLDVGDDGQTVSVTNTPDGKTYAVFSTTASDIAMYPGSGGGYFTGLVQWHDLTPGGDPTVGHRLPGDAFNPYTRGAVISDEAGRAQVLAVQVHQRPDSLYSTGGDYAVFDPATGAEVARFTRPLEASPNVSFYGGVQNRYEVERLAVYPDPSGRRNVWWAVERRPNLQNGYETHVVRYTYTTTGGIEATNADDLPSTDFTFAPDGTRAYFVSHALSSETITGVAVGADGVPGAVIGTTAAIDGRSDTNLGIWAGSVYQMTDSGSVFATLNRFAPAAAGSGQLFDPARSAAFRTGNYGWAWAPGDVAGQAVLGVTTSADDATIYVYAQGTGVSTGGANGRGVFAIRDSRFTDAPDGWYADPTPVPADAGVRAFGTSTSSNGITQALAGGVLYGVQTFLGKLVDVPVTPQVLADVQRLGADTYFSALYSYVDFGLNITAVYGITPPALHVITNNDGISKQIRTVAASAVSPDGRYLYAVSTVDNAVGVYDTTARTWTATFFDGYELPTGALAGVNAITVSRDASGAQYAVVVSPVTGTVTTFKTVATDQVVNGTTVYGSRTTTPFVTARPDFVGVTGLAYSPAAGSLYTLAGTTVRRYAVPADASSVGAAQATATVTNPAGIRLVNGTLFAITDGGSAVRVLDPLTLAVLSSVTGLSHVTDLALAGGRVYASSSDGRLDVLPLAGVQVGSPVQTFTNNVDGVRGLGGATAVAVSADGQYVFVAGGTDNAIAVFYRDTATGLVTFVQAVRDGRLATGINQPTGLYGVGNQLFVASGAGRNGTSGGFAHLDVRPAGDAKPTDVRTTFTNIEGLTLTGGDANDVVRLLAAPAASPLVGPIPVTVVAAGGDDTVAVSDVGPRGSRLTIDGGDGSDLVTVTQATDRSAGTGTSTVSITGGSGDDEVSVQALPAGTTAAISLNQGGADIDVVRVRGRGVPQSSAVAVTGDLATGTGTSFAGDALIYDGQGAGFGNPAARSADTISLAGQGPVSFTNLYKGSPDTQQVFLVASPQPVLGGATVREGDGLTLTAVDQSNQSNVTYAWDLDGDGDFTDATGATPQLSWGRLRSFGMDDGPHAYPVAVRATTTQNAVQFGGRVFQLSADAAAVVTVLDAAPTLAAVPTAATLGVPFTLPLSAADPGDDRVRVWTVSWGDGTAPEDFGADAASAAHTYAAVGNFTVTVTATDEDGDTAVTGTVRVRPGAGSVAVASVTGSLAEGEDGFSAAARFVGSPIRFVWTVGTGTVTTAGGALAVTWSQLNALGVRDNGTFTLGVTAVYSDGTAEYPAVSGTVPFTVVNTAPTGALTLNTPGVPEGSAAGAVTVALTGYADPSPADAAGTARVDYDFDANGTIDLPDQLVGAPVGVPAGVLAQAGTKTMRAVLRDKDGGNRELYATFVVADVTTTLTLDPVAAVNEGGTTAITVRAADPGGASVGSWLVEWGDGSADTVPGNGLTAQTFTHVYADGDVYGITVTAATAGGPVSASAVATVNDTAPTVVLATTTPVVTEGDADAFVLHLSTGDPGADPVAALVIDWGDGTTQTVSGDTTDVTHTYATVPAGGTAAVRVAALTNDDGTFADPSNVLAVTVRNAAPAIPAALLTIPAFGAEATPIDLSAVAASVATGAEPLSFRWEITGPNGFSLTVPPAAGGVFLADPGTLPGYEYASRGGVSFTPTDDGPYTVKLTVTDDDGGTAIVTRTIAVANLDPTIDAFDVPGSGAEGHMVNLSAAASDPAGAADPLAYTWTVIDRATGQTVATLHGAAAAFTPYGGSFAVHLDATDGDGGLASRTAELDATNAAPTVAPGSFSVPATGREGDTATFSVTGTDDGGADGLRYQWRVDGPNGRFAVLTGASVQYLWPDDGSYTVAVTITDRSGAAVTRSATVAVANRPPVIGTATTPHAGTEGVGLALHAAATDPAGANDSLGFRWTIIGPGGTPVTLGGTDPTFTPPDDGDYAVSLTVSDEDGGSVTTGLGTITVANAAPVVGVVVLPAGLLTEGQTAHLSVPAATDVAADLPKLTYAWAVTTPNGGVLAFGGTDVNVPLADNGTYLVRLTVSDTDGGSVVKTASFDVANAAPTVTGVTIPARGYVEKPVALSAAATDPAGTADPLTYTWTVTGPTGTRTLTGAAPSFLPDAPGNYAVGLTVTDCDGGSATHTGTVAVVASPVTVTSFVLPAAAAEAAPVRLTAAAADELGGAVALTWTITPPAGAPFHLTGGDVSFTPPDDGTYRVSLTAVSANGSATAAADLAVANLPPVLSTVTLPTAATTGLPVALTAAAADPAGAADPLAYTWTITPPAGVSFTLAGPAVCFTPVQLGMYDLRLEVTDGDGGRAAFRRLLPVLNAPPAANAGGAYSVPEGGTVRLTAAGSVDPNQTTSSLAFAWDLDGNGVFGEANGAYGDERGMTPTFDAAALDGPVTRTVRVRVTDAAGASDTAAAVVTVNNVAPTAAFTSNGTVTYGTTSVVVFASPYDPAAADRAAGFRYSYSLDGTTFTTPAASPTAAYNLGAGTQTVYGRIYDKNGDFTQYATAVVVTKAHLTVTADGKTRFFGTANPALTYTVTGFQYGQTLANSGVTGSPALATAATVASPVGAYAITTGLGTLAAANYDFPMLVGGTLTVGLPDEAGYILGATGTTVTAGGNAVVQLPGGLSVHSSAASAVSASGDASVNAGGVLEVVGGVSTSGHGVATKTGTPAATTDPLINLPTPALTGLTNYGAVSVSGNTTLTLGPGVYTSIQVSGNATVTLTAGRFVILGGGLTVSGNASLTGTGVLLFNAGSGYNGTTDGGTYGAITLGGTGTLTLSPGTTAGDPFAGVLVFQSRANTKVLNINGNSALNVRGTIYAPAAQLAVSGSGVLHDTLVVSSLSASGSAGAFQLAAGASSAYVSSTANQLVHPILTVAVQDDTGAGLDPAKVRELSAAMGYLNEALALFGVDLSWAAAGEPADVHVHFAATTPQGGAADGVLGFTTASNDVYFPTGWAMYTGSDPAGIGAGQYDYLTLATHELAHTLGLGESADPGSVMYEYLAPGTVRRTFTESNLSLINSDADRFMKVGRDHPGAGGGGAGIGGGRPPVSGVAPGIIDPTAIAAGPHAIGAGYADGVYSAGIEGSRPLTVITPAAERGLGSADYHGGGQVAFGGSTAGRITINLTGTSTTGNPGYQQGEADDREFSTFTIPGPSNGSGHTVTGEQPTGLPDGPETPGIITGGVYVDGPENDPFAGLVLGGGADA